ncbi:hypothetical protein [Adonisia turfae]|nr:hypothetical protein [Adonisia turfae]
MPLFLCGLMLIIAMDIVTELEKFDSQHTDTLETLAVRLSPDAALIQTLLEITNDNTPKLQTATTWLLKHFQENGFSFSFQAATKAVMIPKKQRLFVLTDTQQHAKYYLELH